MCSIKLSADMMMLLDEQLIKTQMSISSPYAQNLLPELKEWLNKLLSLRSTLDVYHKAETKWLYLEPLFSAEDIVNFKLSCHPIMFSFLAIIASMATHLIIFIL